MLPTLPSISKKRIAVRVTAVAERNLKQGHPWLFANSIESVSFNGRSGDIAVVFDRKRRFLAVGLYDPDSPIRVRILQNRPATIDTDWFKQKIAEAAKVREPLLETGTTGYRLIHGENDQFSGLIVDRYEETLVVKLYTAVWFPHLEVILAGLTAVLAPKRIVLRFSRDLQKQDCFGLQDGTVIQGEPITGFVQFRENNLLFAADVVRGQKTGFFLDQRDNRAWVESMAKGKSVLNVFAYTGGFSLYAARGGATDVASLDLSEPALQTAVHNFNLNHISTPHELIQGDAFVKLKELRENGRQFGMVIIDPPSFAKKQSEVEGALRAYGRLVQLGLSVLKPNGTFVMASCSSRISADQFYKLVLEGARKVKRPLREISRSQHAVDHPVKFKEGAYLKCLFAHVA